MQIGIPDNTFSSSCKYSCGEGLPTQGETYQQVERLSLAKDYLLEDIPFFHITNIPSSRSPESPEIEQLPTWRIITWITEGEMSLRLNPLAMVINTASRNNKCMVHSHFDLLGITAQNTRLLRTELNAPVGNWRQIS